MDLMNDTTFAALSDIPAFTCIEVYKTTIHLHAPISTDIDKLDKSRAPVCRREDLHETTLIVFKPNAINKIQTALFKWQTLCIVY